MPNFATDMPTVQAQRMRLAALAGNLSIPRKYAIKHLTVLCLKTKLDVQVYLKYHIVEGKSIIILLRQ